MHPLRKLSPSDLETYDRSLRETARRLSRCTHFADEVVQEVWVEAYRNPPRHLENFRGWLQVAATRTAFRLRKRRASRRRWEQAAARPERAPSFEEDILRQVLRTRIRRAIEGLPAPYREVFRLRFVEGVTVGTIASRLNRPEPSIRTQLRRGLIQLRIELADLEEQRGTLSGLLFLIVGRRFGGAGIQAAVVTGALVLMATVGLLVSMGDTSTTSSGIASRPTPIPGDAEWLRPASEPVGLGSRYTPTRVLAGASEMPVAPPTSEAMSPVVVSGSVHAQGRTYPGAEIWVAPLERPNDGRVVAVADDDGNFEVEGIDPRHWIWANGPRVISSFRQRIDSVETEGRGELRLDLGRPVGQLSLQLLDHRGTPVPNARLTFEPREQYEPKWGATGTLTLAPPGAVVFTDSKGRATADQPITRCTVQVRIEGQLIYAQEHLFEKRGLDRELVLTLPEPAHLSGRLFGADGNPIAEATVLASGAPNIPELSATTAEDGRYQFRQLPVRRITLRASAPDAARPGSVRQQITLRSGSNRRNLWLSDESAIVGRVLSADGPVAGGRVEAWAHSTGGKSREAVTVTGPDGQFRFDGMEDREYDLFAYAVKHRSPFPNTRVPGVTPGWNDIIALELDGSSASLTGSIITAESDVAIALELHGASLPEPVHLMLDRSGQFEISGLPKGDYELCAVAPSRGFYVLDTFSLGAGSTLNLNPLSIPMPASLRIIAHTPEDTVVSFLPSKLRKDHYRIMVHPKTQSMVADQGANTLYFGEIPPGDYFAKVRMRNFATIVFPIRIREGEAREMDVELEPGSTVMVHFQLPGPLEAGEQVYCEDTLNGEARDLTGLLSPPNRVRDTWDIQMEWAVGTHRIAFRTSSGLHGETSLAVGADDALRRQVIEVR